MDTTDKSTNLFDRLYEGASEAIKMMKKPLIIRSLKRKFQSAHDDAQKQIDAAELNKHKVYENLAEVDINVLMEHCASIRAAKEVVEDLKAEYKALFGEELEVAE